MPVSCMRRQEPDWTRIPGLGSGDGVAAVAGILNEADDLCLLCHHPGHRVPAGNPDAGDDEVVGDGTAVVLMHLLVVAVVVVGAGCMMKQQLFGENQLCGGN